MKLKQLIFTTIRSNEFIYRGYMYCFRVLAPKDKIRLFYSVKDLTEKNYEKVKKNKNTEKEHQIGRLINIQKIVKECKKLQGDFIEFGTWKGFSLLWIAKFMDDNKIHNRKLIGVDGFIGLPYADGVFHKFDFADTTLQECRENIYKSKEIGDKIKKNILIAKYLYKDKNDILTYLKSENVNKLCFIHIDCDVTKSFLEISKILSKKNILADKCFILFDDYGCDSGLKKAVDIYFKSLSHKWKIKEHSSTLLTKNFMLQRKA